MKEINNKEKDQALEKAMEQVQKKYGKGAIMKMSDAPIGNVESFHTGSISLDMALGIGGLPKGRVVAIYGPESSGKTTEKLH